ncbi:hypothetical protein FOZ63_026253 [Perkinsus olseni]|uniref:Vesicle transport protein USE1 n=1 Tax=Perkinsus olseni TaxID=32597 RepID=A0A7J6TCT6_PEROL|nr:hypothetical protein FOZ63_026253 [Perkinsus olseni]
MSTEGPPRQPQPPGHRPASVSGLSAASSRATVVASHPHLVTPTMIRSKNGTQEAEALLAYSKGLAMDSSANRALRLLACKKLAVEVDEDLAPLLEEAYCTDIDDDDDVESYSDSSSSGGEEEAESADVVEVPPTDDDISKEPSKPEANDRERLFEGLRKRERSADDTEAAGGHGALLDEMLELTGHVRESANRQRETLAKDNANLELTKTLQDQHLESVTKENQRGTQLLKARRLGFFTTIILVLISIIMYCFMVPFIFYTKALPGN